MRTADGSESQVGEVSVEELNAAIVAARTDLLRRALYLTRDPDQAMDLVQRTAMRACASRRQLRPGSNAAHWLGAILSTQFIDEFRRQRASPISHAVAYDNIALPPADEVPLWTCLGIADLVAATRRIPDHFRVPFELFALRGLSHRAIARRLELPVGTIATRIFRAKRLLKGILTARALRRQVEAAIPIQGRAPANQAGVAHPARRRSRAPAAAGSISQSA